MTRSVENHAGFEISAGCTSVRLLRTESVEHLYPAPLLEYFTCRPDCAGGTVPIAILVNRYAALRIFSIGTPGMRAETVQNEKASRELKHPAIFIIYSRPARPQYLARPSQINRS